MDLVLKHTKMAPDILGHLFKETDKVLELVFGRMVLVFGEWKLDKPEGAGVFINTQSVKQQGLWKKGKLLRKMQMWSQKSYSPLPAAFKVA